jgi:hypothetical protein
VNLYGAKFQEILGVMNHIASDASFEDWKLVSGQLVCEGLISGVNLRLRHLYHDKGLSRVSLTGKGWMAGFDVTKRRPRSMPDDVISETANVVLAHPLVIRLVSKEAYINSHVTIFPDPKLCFHGGGIVSPEAFRTEMTILRMFSSEWEL